MLEQFTKCALRRADAVETGGIICPVGIAEVERAVGELEALQRNPIGVGQACGGLYYDGVVWSASDVEAESGRPDAEAGVTGLDQRIPEMDHATFDKTGPTAGYAPSGADTPPEGGAWKEV